MTHKPSALTERYLERDGNRLLLRVALIAAIVLFEFAAER